MAGDVLYKHSSSKPSYIVDFTRLLPSDTTITAASSVSAAYNSLGTAVTVSTISEAVSVSGMSMTVPLKAGSDGEDYRLELNGIGTTTGKNIVFVLEMRVRDKLAGVV